MGAQIPQKGVQPVKTLWILVVLAAVVLAIRIVIGVPVVSGQPTPTPTPTPTPQTWPSTVGTFVNDTGQVVNDLHVEVDLAADADLLVNAPGCPTPSGVGGILFSSVNIVWPTPCVDPGESVTLEFFTDCTFCAPPQHTLSLLDAGRDAGGHVHTYAHAHANTGPGRRRRPRHRRQLP